jgi:hypothetical protein
VTTFEITVRLPAENRHHVGAKKEVTIYHEFATDDFFHSSHHSSQLCDGHNKIPIVKSVVAKCDERAPASVAPSVADAFGLQGCLSAGKAQKRTLEEELSMARDALASRSAELADLDDKLAPVWTAEQALKDSLSCTHERGPIPGLNLSRRQERVSLFKRLDEFAIKWGKTKTERRFVNSEIRSLSRLVDNLSRQIEKQRSKHGRQAQAGRGR